MAQVLYNRGTHKQEMGEWVAIEGTHSAMQSPTSAAQSNSSGTAPMLPQRLRVAALPQPACLEDFDARISRNLDTALMNIVRDLGWIDRHLNVLIMAPPG